MPIPFPRKSETSEKFISRCMGDSVMNKDYPDNKQRYAICQSQLRKRNKAQALIEQIMKIFIKSKNG